MTNPKGTVGETAVARWLQSNGFPGAERKVKYGSRDQGDLNVCPGLVAEVKNYRLPTGIPTPKQLEAWLEQCAAEKANAGAAYCPLIVKRPGTADVGRWHAYMPMADFALLTGGYMPASVDEQPVMITAAALVQILRAHGFGDPIEIGDAA